MKQDKNLGQYGFSHVFIFLIFIVVAVVGFVGWRVMNSSTTKPPAQSTHSSEKASADEPDVELHNLGLSTLDGVLISQYAVSEYAAHGLKGFYVFGDKLSGGRINPNFEYASLKEGTKVVAAIDGVVAFIKEQSDSKDFEVFIQPKDGSMWTIGYDHLTKLAVKKGDTVKAGAILGEPALQNNGLPRFELQINKDENGTTTHYCPSSLLAANVKDKLLADLSAMQNSWESATGLELYDLAAQNPVGCIKQTMTSHEAEGL